MSDKPIIELIRTVAWGDVLMTTATFGGLAEQGYAIRYVTTDSLSTLLAHNPLVDELVVVPPSRTGNWFRSWHLLQQVASATRGMQRPARRILFKNSPSHTLLRSGLNLIKPGWGNTTPVMGHHLRHVCAQAAVPYSDELMLAFTDEELAWGQQFSDSVLLHMFSSNPAKDWPMARWQALAHYIEDHHGLSVFQVGKPWHEAADVIPCINNPSMRHAMAAVAQCRLFVGIDSVFNHVCRAVNRPAVILFGATHPGQYGYGQNLNLWQGGQWSFTKGCLEAAGLPLSDDIPAAWGQPGFMVQSGTHSAMAANTLQLVAAATNAALATPVGGDLRQAALA
ncbi:MAG: hypothetical protein KC475_08100 [Cyanobacteria bacterium HKST-UBA03]|nr:hypothetical protein [Cyanobacteria bacterium HKST-UBA03]